MNKKLGAAVAGTVMLMTGAVAVGQGPPVCDGPRCIGTKGNDTIIASTGEETVIGRRGDDDIELDALIAVGSDDVGRGNRGRDCIDGGAGNDLMVGGRGDDNRPCEFTAFVNPRAGLTSGPGDDKVLGRSGDDSMDGIAGSDVLVGNRGNDLIEDFMVNDSDRMRGGRGADELNALDGDGDDLVNGGPGTDNCMGDSMDEFKNCETEPQVSNR